MAITSLSTSSLVSGVKRRRVWDQNAVANSFFSIATYNVSAGGTSNVEFTNIPQNYTHLQVRGILQTNRPSYVVDVIKMQFNSDTTSNYSHHKIRGGYDTTPAAVSASVSNDTYINIGDLNSSVSSNVFSGLVIDILDYKDTNKYKTARGLTGFDVNGTTGTDSYGGTVSFFSGNWRSTAAISSIKFTINTGTAFNQYSSFALYGVLA
jgi:hypothetical protein